MQIETFRPESGNTVNKCFATIWSVGTAKWEERPNYVDIHKGVLPSRSMSRSQKAYVSNMANNADSQTIFVQHKIICTQVCNTCINMQLSHGFWFVGQLFWSASNVCMCFSQDSQGYADDGSFETSSNQRIHSTSGSIWLVACSAGNELPMRVCTAHAYRMHMQAGILKKVWWAGAAIHNICIMHNTEYIIYKYKI